MVVCLFLNHHCGVRHDCVHLPYAAVSSDSTLLSSSGRVTHCTCLDTAPRTLTRLPAAVTPDTFRLNIPFALPFVPRLVATLPLRGGIAAQRSVHHACTLPTAHTHGGTACGCLVLVKRCSPAADTVTAIAEQFRLTCSPHPPPTTRAACLPHRAPLARTPHLRVFTDEFVILGLRGPYCCRAHGHRFICRGWSSRHTILHYSFIVVRHIHTRLYALPDGTDVGLIQFISHG